MGDDDEMALLIGQIGMMFRKNCYKGKKYGKIFQNKLKLEPAGKKRKLKEFQVQNAL